MADITDSSFLRRPAFTVKNNRSCSATACSVFQIFVYGFLAALTIFYLSYFAYANGHLKKDDGGRKIDCLLFANDDSRGSAGSCSFFLGGSGVCAGLLVILLIVNIFGALCGKW